MALRKLRGEKQVARRMLGEVAEEVGTQPKITAAAALAAVNATHPVRLRREPAMIAVHLCGTQKVAPPEGFSGPHASVPLAHF